MPFLKTTIFSKSFRFSSVRFPRIAYARGEPRTDREIAQRIPNHPRDHKKERNPEGVVFQFFRRSS